MDATRFRERDVVLDGIVGENVAVLSGDPINYHHAIEDPGGCDEVAIDGKLFLPAGDHEVGLVLIVPGSLGVADSHLAHAEVLLGLGYATFVLDPFGARAVASTVSNQTKYSFAASAFDVLAAYGTLCDHSRIDTTRVSAQGHSRGGSAVLMASMRSFADPMVGPHRGLAGTYAVYPWCGHQFVVPDVGTTRVRAIVGDRDDWVSVQQVQSQIQAIGLTGGDASTAIIRGASHSFDRNEPLYEIPEASVAPTAPTVMLTGDGSMIDPWTAVADAGLDDRAMFLASVQGHGVRGAAIGGTDEQADLFRADMAAFHAAVLQ